MQKLLFSLLLPLYTVTLAASQPPAYGYRAFTAEGNTLPYRILLPPNFSEAEQYPLVLFLHGAGERGGNNQKQLVHGSQLFLENQADYPAIVIFPQCPANDYWSNVNITKDAAGNRSFQFKPDGPPTPAMKLLLALVDSLVALPQVNTRQVYVGGLSMGGMGTFELVSRRPNTFAAAISICGGGNPQSVANYAGQVPFWIFHGEQDDIVPPVYSRTMAAAITEAGGQAKLTVYPNANHNSWDSAFAEPELLPWLFAQKRK